MPSIQVHVRLFLIIFHFIFCLMRERIPISSVIIAAMAIVIGGLVLYHEYYSSTARNTGNETAAVVNVQSCALLN